MKNLILILLFACLIYGCSKDDNPLTNNTGTPTVNGWYQIYTNLDSMYIGSSGQRMGYVAAANYRDVWLKFDYKVDSNFLSTDSSFAFEIDYVAVPYLYRATLKNVTNRSWLTYSDSGSRYLAFPNDSLWYSVHGIPYSKKIYMKNLTVYMK